MFQLLVRNDDFCYCVAAAAVVVVVVVAVVVVVVDVVVVVVLVCCVVVLSPSLGPGGHPVEGVALGVAVVKPTHQTKHKMKTLFNGGNALFNVISLTCSGLTTF